MDKSNSTLHYDFPKWCMWLKSPFLLFHAIVQYIHYVFIYVLLVYIDRVFDNKSLCLNLILEISYTVGHSIKPNILYCVLNFVLSYKPMV